MCVYYFIETLRDPIFYSLTKTVILLESRKLYDYVVSIVVCVEVSLLTSYVVKESLRINIWWIPRSRGVSCAGLCFRIFYRFRGRSKIQELILRYLISNFLDLKWSFFKEYTVCCNDKNIVREFMIFFGCYYLWNIDHSDFIRQEWDFWTSSSRIVGHNGWTIFFDPTKT